MFLDRGLFIRIEIKIVSLGEHRLLSISTKLCTENTFFIMQMTNKNLNHLKVHESSMSTGLAASKVDFKLSLLTTSIL
jgi:hypothetical protein